MITDGHIKVTSEIGKLRRLIVHSPDGGIGKIVPGKFKEWLYDDTVHLSQMRKEYNIYIKILLFFLDPEKAQYVCDFEKNTSDSNRYDCYKPGNNAYFDSTFVLDSQQMLAKILENEETQKRMIAAICAWEGVSIATEKKLERIEDPHTLARVLITGALVHNDKPEFFFPPLPNFIFTRDIGITINEHFLLNNAHDAARERESLLMRYIAQHLLFKNNEEKLIEISEPGNFFLFDEEMQTKRKTTIEGGDVMMIAPNHLLVGSSERTNASGINELIHAIFKNNKTGIEKITVIQIPKQRAIMHIDTVFTQISRSTWVLFGRFSEKIGQARERKSYYERITHDTSAVRENHVEIFRFQKDKNEAYSPEKNYEIYIGDKITGLESLLRNISIEDYNVPPEKVKIIYSADNIFPYDEREQWTDSCNVLALKEGVVLGYERNEKTAETFVRKGFQVVHAEELLDDFIKGKRKPEQTENTLILLSSHELSRARGGPHCMSMPLCRDEIN